MVLPLWAAIVGVSLAKKALFLAAAKVYGIPRLYRKTQKLALWSISDPATQKHVALSIRKAYRYPGSLAARLFGPGPIVARTLRKPVGDYDLLTAAKASTRSRQLPKQSFASSATVSAPATRRLRETLHSGQHYLYFLRGASVPGLAKQAGLQYSRVKASAPTAAAALRHLRKPFNYVLGQPMAGAACTCLAAELA